MNCMFLKTRKRAGVGFFAFVLSGNGSPLSSPPSTRPEQNGFDEVVVIKGGKSSYEAGIGL